jgi:hypothetical protein
MGNAMQDDSVALVVVTVAAVVVVIREEGSNSDTGVHLSSGTISAEEGIIPVHSKPLAAHPTEAVLFHASQKTAQNLAFVMCFIKTFSLKIRK